MEELRKRGDGPAATLAERLWGARRRRFVGRESELELVRTALAASEPPFAVLFVHGPGGVGKSALLRAAADVAQELGVPAADVDLRAVEPSPAGFCRALGDRLGLAGEDVHAGRLGGGRRLIALDTYLRRLFAAAERDEAVALAFLHVSGMIAPSPSLLRPS
ncbi:MAG TPA: AAA family ATPase, partial [Solirubrobacteraceae bacterium]|nr:AAA family ATPase [Solirubrobacteraceae bacterium]